MAVKRVNESVLGPLERPALSWIAIHLPRSVTPNHLTAIGFAGALIAALGFCLSRWSTQWLWISSLGLVVNWFGDSLDGSLARLRNVERQRFGFFVDHTTDMFSQVMIFISLGASRFAHFGIACVGLIVFLMAFVYTLIGTHVRQRMRITYFGFGPTEIRLLLVIGNLVVLKFGIVDLRSWIAPASSIDYISIHDVVIFAIAVAGAILLAVLSIREARVLGLEDPIERAELN